MQKVSGLPVSRVWVLTALVALVASLIVVPAQEPTFASTATCPDGSDSEFSGGNGSSTQPFLISSGADLETLADCVNTGNSTYNASGVYYKQTVDNLVWTGATVIGSSADKPFKAHYDGDGKAISGFQNEYGLFGWGNGCEIENLVVSGEVETTEGRSLGVLMGTSTSCSFDGVTVYGSADLDTNGNFHVGGLLGYESSVLTVTNSSVHVDVTIDGGAYYAGGVVGRANGSGDMTSVTVRPKDDPYTTATTQERGSISVGTVAMRGAGGAVGLSKSVDFASVDTGIPITTSFTSTSTNHKIGGLIGDTIDGGSVTDSTSSGAISVEFLGHLGILGGLVGDSKVSVSNSSSTSTISVKIGHIATSVGGLVGSSSGPISQSFYSGTIDVPSENNPNLKIESDSIGGLVGNLTSSVSESYANVTFTGIAVRPAGLVGSLANATAAVTDSFAYGDIAGVQPSGLITRMHSSSSASAAKVTNSFTFATLAPTDTTKWYPVVRGFKVSDSVYWNRTQTGPPPGDLTKPNFDQGAEELSDEDFVDSAKFSGWDFSSTWTMGSCAPYLTWMGSSPRGLCPAVVPDAPTLNAVTAGDSLLTIAFTQGFDGGDEIIDYKYSLDGAPPVALNDMSSPVTITDLSNGITYEVRLTAVNRVGVSAESTPLLGTPVAPTPPPSDPAPTPASTPEQDPAPTPTTEQDPTPAPAPRPASVPTPAVEPPVASDPVSPTPTPTPPPAADPAPAAETPAGPGALVLRAEEVFEGTIFMATDTEELIMPAFVLQDIATRLAPDGAPLEEGALVIESGRAMIPVLIIQLGDVRLAAADMGETIQFTLNIPGFESISMSVAVQKQALV